MDLIDLSIEARGFAPASIAIAVRTIGSCPAARHRPDSRILVGIGILAVVPDPDGGPRFATDAMCLSEHDSAVDLLDWLQPQIPSDDGAIVTYSNWGSVPRRLIALADPTLHPNIVKAAADTSGRWRDMPRGHTWHLRQARAMHMPCLCRPNTPVDECDAAVPTYLLPNPVTTAAELIGEAIAGWQCWARMFGDFDDPLHPAQSALRALDRWCADQHTAR